MRSHNKTAQAYYRVIDYLSDHGSITHQKACEIGGWNHATYHLARLCQRGDLKRKGYNKWTWAKPCCNLPLKQRRFCECRW
jgi:hypothetical protein